MIPKLIRHGGEKVGRGRTGPGHRGPFAARCSADQPAAGPRARGRRVDQPGPGGFAAGARGHYRVPGRRTPGPAPLSPARESSRERPGLPDVPALHMVTGASDYVAHVAVPSPDHLRDFVLTLAARPEIADIRTSIIYQSLRTAAVPVAELPGWLGGTNQALRAWRTARSRSSSSRKRASAKRWAAARRSRSAGVAGDGRRLPTMSYSTSGR